MRGADRYVRNLSWPYTTTPVGRDFTAAQARLLSGDVPRMSGLFDAVGFIIVDREMEEPPAEPTTSNADAPKGSP